MPTTPTTQNPRGYGDVRQNDVNMPNAVNVIKNQISRDVQQVFENSGTDGGGNFTSAQITVPANRAEWTDTGMVLTGADALALSATGSVAFNSNADATFYSAQSGGNLHFVVVAEGIAPNDDTPGEFDFAGQSTITGAIGRVWARVRDVGGSGDNQGAFDVTLIRFEDARTAFRLAAQTIRQTEVLGLSDALAGRVERDTLRRAACVVKRNNTTQLSGGGFNTIAMDTVDYDGGNNFDAGASHYVVPMDGFYQVVSKLRINEITNVVSYGQGASTSNGEGPHFLWFSTAPTTISGYSRNGSLNVRSAFFKKGDRIRLYAYWDSSSTVNIVFAELNVTLIFKT